MSNILLKHVTSAYLENGRESRDVDILICGARIAQVGTDLTSDGSALIVECSGKVALPGLINCHHHFFQILTRCLPGAQDSGLFDWLTYHYPIWLHFDDQAFYAAARLAIAELLLSGCTTSSDHHYLFPTGNRQDPLALEILAAKELGIRFIGTRGSMTLGARDGGLPPDELVESDEQVLLHSEEVIARYHDGAPDSMCQIHLAPCSPFNVTKSLLLETARLARKHGVRLHTHLAETRDELAYCRDRYHCTPLELMEQVEWLGQDVWFAHGIFFTDSELAKLSATKSGICHCPSSNMRLGSGVARIPDLMSRGIPLGLGVDGSASNDGCNMLAELRQAMLLTRVIHSPAAMTARQAIDMATAGSAELLGMSGVGKLEEGYAADIVLFDLDEAGYAGAADPIAATVFCQSNRRAWCVIVNGKIVVESGRLVTGDEISIAREARVAAQALWRRAGLI